MSTSRRLTGASPALDAPARDRRWAVAVIGGLSFRMAVACGVLALLVGGAFVFLLVTVTDLRHSTELRRHTREELRAADALEKLVIDLETGLRGFVITREERFLAPWKAARVALPGQAAALEHLVAKDPVQLGRVRRIARDAASYVRDDEALRGNAVHRLPG